LPPPPLEADIQSAWGRASATLPRVQPDTQEVIDLVASLRDCAARSKVIGFVTGERELLRMASFLEGRISPAVITRYGADGRIQPV
jgi:hypothetical protein